MKAAVGNERLVEPYMVRRPGSLDGTLLETFLEARCELGIKQISQGPGNRGGPGWQEESVVILVKHSL